jgi:acyl-CoA synthetase (AMP-forming)/AMP-acid ligase II
MPKRLYSLELDDQLLVSVGIARTGVEIKVVDSQESVMHPGETGEILVRSDIVMRGYWQNPQATERALGGGRLHTGDLGSMDERGFLWLKDRSKDLIISGGSNIYPREVEDVLLLDSTVSEVSVIGEPDPEWGESVVAFIVPKYGCVPTAAQLDRLCLDSLARFKRPKRYVFVDRLPRNSTGKVLKTELRAQLSNSGGADDKKQ